jgi:hypothetical protein
MNLRAGAPPLSPCFGDRVGTGNWQLLLHRHKWAGAPGAAVPALQPEYGSARQRGQVTKVAIGAPILLLLPKWESGVRSGSAARPGPQRAPKLRLLGWLSAASRALNIYCPPERGRVRHGEPVRVEEPAPSEAEGTPIAATNLAAHYPLATSHYPLPLSFRLSGGICCRQAASQPKLDYHALAVPLF